MARSPDSGLWILEPCGLPPGLRTLGIGPPLWGSLLARPPPDSGLWILGGWVGGWVNGEKTGPWILDCVAHVISILSDQICRD